MSGRIKQNEFTCLIAAQIRAAGTTGYREWSEWMRKAFSFSVAMRMAEAMGCTKPGMGWYLEMKRAGERIMEGVDATERARYSFRGDDGENASEGAAETGFRNTRSDVSPSIHRGLFKRPTDRDLLDLQDRYKSTRQSA